MSFKCVIDEYMFNYLKRKKEKKNWSIYNGSLM